MSWPTNKQTINIVSARKHRFRCILLLMHGILANAHIFIFILIPTYYSHIVVINWNTKNWLYTTHESIIYFSIYLSRSLAQRTDSHSHHIFNDKKECRADKTQRTIWKIWKIEASKTAKHTYIRTNLIEIYLLCLHSDHVFNCWVFLVLFLLLWKCDKRTQIWVLSFWLTRSFFLFSLVSMAHYLVFSMPKNRERIYLCF